MEVALKVLRELLITIGFFRIFIMERPGKRMPIDPMSLLYDIEGPCTNIADVFFDIVG